MKNLSGVNALLCIAICGYQISHEVSLYMKNQIYVASDIEQVDEAPIRLVFCDTSPLNNKSVSLSDLKNHFASPMPNTNFNIVSKKLLTLYHGVCIQYNINLLETLGGQYLYSDWGKRKVFFI